MQVVTSINCLDSSGITGTQADLTVFQQMNVYGTTAVTMLTAQNTIGFGGNHPILADFVEQQLETIFRDMEVKVVKIGMLYREDIIRTVVNFIKSKDCKIVLDPVIKTESGLPVLKWKEIEAIRQELLPLASVVTVNVPELGTYSGVAIATEADVEIAAQKLLDLGAKAVIVKGSKLQREHATDTLFTNEEIIYFETERVLTLQTYGASCAFSAALSAGLANGLEVVDAIREAKKYVVCAIKYPINIGLGDGPINHFAYRENFNSIDVKVID
ncbi:MAG: bifunctional hydroxymethylpyrimidine kinase/phosphomethylpyrimidine kinase [Lysinibacillus sp.]